jgi:hypothetical protein
METARSMKQMAIGVCILKALRIHKQNQYQIRFAHEQKTDGRKIAHIRVANGPITEHNRMQRTGNSFPTINVHLRATGTCLLALNMCQMHRINNSAIAPFERAKTTKKHRQIEPETLEKGN